MHSRGGDDRDDGIASVRRLTVAIGVVVGVLGTMAPSAAAAAPSTQPTVSARAAAPAGVPGALTRMVSSAAAVPKTHATLVTNRYAADPGLSKFGSTYYLYATGGGPLPVFKASKPAQRFYQYVHPAVRNSALPRGMNNLWAPHVTRIGTTFVMFFTAAIGGAQHCIWYATAASPTGYFGQLRKLQCGSSNYRVPTAAGDPWEAIDPSTYRSAAGRLYLVYRAATTTTAHRSSSR